MTNVSFDHICSHLSSPSTTRMVHELSRGGRLPPAATGRCSDCKMVRCAQPLPLDLLAPASVSAPAQTSLW